ncbi:MAG: MATE family efflux transporter [Lachnospiraceae bacterium]|nr:MATE family efflux transporter [Lachnospiraceae bacterium]
MPEKRNNLQKMTETPVPQLVVCLGIPAIVSMFVTSIYNMADTYFVSMIGTSASGAVGVVFGLQAVMQAFGFMFGHGAGSVIARHLGAGEKEKATVIASTSFFASIATGLIITITGLLLLDPMMRLFGATETILPYAREYGIFVLLGSPFITASCVMNNILRYEGRALLAMVGLTFGGILNIGLDPVFMFGLSMGTKGAGLSTMLSQLTSFILLLSMFLRRKSESRIRITKVSRRLKDLFEIISVGAASFIRQGLNSVSTMILNNQAAFFGGDPAVAAMSITNRMVFLVFSVALGVGQGFQPVAGFNYGAGKFKRVRQGFFFTLSLGAVFIGAASVVTFIFAGDIVAFFRDDPLVIEIGTPALRAASIVLISHPFAVTSNMLFQSLGKAGRASLLSALRSGLFFIPLILILPNFFGLRGVWLSQPVADVLTAAVSFPIALQYTSHLKKLESIKL